MRMTRAAALAVALLCVGAAIGQRNTLRWSLDAEQSVRQAQQTHKPLMFYVMGSSRHRDDRLERDQKRAFADARVVFQASRFVPVKIYRSQHKDIIEQLGISDRANMEVVFATPSGEKLDNLSPGGVANAESFAQKMGLVFNAYRQKMYREEIQPKLQSAETPLPELKVALGLILDFTITDADKDVVALLERMPPDEVMRASLTLLGHLSTRTSVATLLAITPEPEAKYEQWAREALEKCTPAAAEEFLLPLLDSEDPAERIKGYDLVTKICNIKSRKPERFWQGENERVKAEELERVKKIVRDTARRWRAEHEWR